MIERNAKLITRKFYQYLIPSVLMIFAMQFGSLLDGIIIGNTIGSAALSATSLVMPVLYVIQVPGFALGVGGSIVVANLLGKRDLNRASKVFSASLIYGTAISAVFSVIAPFVSGPLATLFAETLYDYSYGYILVYMLVNPIMMLAIMVASFISTDNNPKISALLYVVATAIKVGSEILFISVFGMGIIGAALSTGVGYGLALIVVVFYAYSKKRMLKFTFNLKGIAADLKNAVKAATSTALMYLLMAVQTFIINVVLSNLITDELDLIIFGLVSNLLFVFELLSGGILGVIPNVCGVLYGEKDTFSLKSVARKIYIINICVCAFITALILAFPSIYAAAFGFTESGEALKRADYMIRIFVLCAIPLEINKFSINYYPSVGKNFPAILTVILRDALLVIPLSLWLMKTDGLFGYSIAHVITEIAAILITYAVITVINVKGKRTHGIFMIEKTDFKSFDVTVENKPENAAIISEKITEFAIGSGVSNRNAQVVGLAAEEMVANVIEYGYKKQKPNYIDVNVKVGDGELILRLRDDGMPFDPTKYDFEKDENYTTIGIGMITKLSDEITYLRLLNLNNTVIKIKTGE
ncbi:MAG: MATE family efflux transporter [Clostridia bacterium]|nr:MATE family efflux transporter [Clostridia bacterium]